MPTITTDKTYRIQRDNCQAVLIDVQEKLTPSIYRSPDIIDKTIILMKGLHILRVPILLSKQYKFWNSVKTIFWCICQTDNFLDVTLEYENL